MHYGSPHMTWLLIIVVAVVVFLLVTTASQHRRHTMATRQRQCRNCATQHPAFAKFCRKCGRKLERRPS